MSVRMSRRLAGLLGCFGTLFAALPAMAKECEPIAHGSSQIVFSGWPGPKLPVFMHKPQTAGPNSRIVFVMHGVNRDGDRYRDEWRDLAEKHSLVIVVPTFGKKDFSTTGSYNLGNIVQLSCHYTFPIGGEINVRFREHLLCPRMAAMLSCPESQLLID